MAKESFVTKYIVLKEKYENEKRKFPAKSYLGLFGNILKGMFSKLTLTNLIMLIAFLPTVIILWYKNITVQSNGMTLPFAGNVGVGYPSAISLIGETERIIFQTNLVFNGMLIVTSLFLAFALSGGFYLIRQYVLGNNPSIGTFFKGVKQNYLSMLFIMAFFTIFYFLHSFIVSYCNYAIVLNPSLKVILTISKVASYIFLGIATIMTFWMLSMTASYKMSPWVLLKNSFLMVWGFFPTNVVFGGLIILPAVFLLNFSNTSIIMFGIIVYGFIGIALSMLCWMCYSQWAFDKYFPKVEVKTEEKKYTSISYSFDESGRAKAEVVEHKVEVLKTKYVLASKPIKPFNDEMQVYSMPASFTREDLKKVVESKKTLVEDSNNYYENHKNDEKYVEYNKQFEIVRKAPSSKGKKQPKGDFLNNGKGV